MSQKRKYFVVLEGDVLSPIDPELTEVAAEIDEKIGAMLGDFQVEDVTVYENLEDLVRDQEIASKE